MNVELEIREYCMEHILDYNPSNILLARDWSKRVTLTNIPLLKPGDIRGYFATERF